MHLGTRLGERVQQQGAHIGQAARFHAERLTALGREKAAIADFGSHKQNPGSPSAFWRGFLESRRRGFGCRLNGGRWGTHGRLFLRNSGSRSDDVLCMSRSQALGY